MEPREVELFKSESTEWTDGWRFLITKYLQVVLEDGCCLWFHMSTMSRNHAPFTDTILRPARLAEKLGCSKVTVWRMRQRGELPQPIQISVGVIGWSEKAIDQWLASRNQAGERKDVSR